MGNKIKYFGLIIDETNVRFVISKVKQYFQFILFVDSTCEFTMLIKLKN